IREELSMILQFKVKDPGVAHVTITEVRVTPDLKLARINYSVLGTDDDRRLAARALRRCNGFMRSEVGRALDMRYAPELTFFHDDGFAQVARIDHLLDMVAKEEADREKPEGKGSKDDE
ncbi:MAG TPA: 30S ribosome-binding factor RbfA, partial [Candidatus Deferrimicrobiaceae bacterium]